MAKNRMRRGVETISSSKTLADDMPVRNSLLQQDPLIVQQVIWRNENPMSPARMFGGGFALFSQSFSVTEGVREQAPNVELIFKGNGLNFISIKEIYEEGEYNLIIDNSNVKDTVYGQEQFEITLTHPYQSNEIFQDRRGENNYRVVSVQTSTGIGFTHTVVVSNGSPSDVFTGIRDLLTVSTSVVSIGNAFPEASRDSNTLRKGPEKADYIYNVMKIQRYKTSRTGSAMSDRLYAMTRTLSSGEEKQWYLRLPEMLLMKVLKQWESSLVHSKAGFDAETMEIFNHSTTSGDYSELSIYSGIREQLSNVKIKFPASTVMSNRSKLKVLENAHASLINAGFTGGIGKKVALIAMGAAAEKWALHALLWGGLQKTEGIIQRTQEVGERNSVANGITLKSYFMEDGTEYLIYNMASNMFDKGRVRPGETPFVYDGTASPAWTNKIYLMPLGGKRQRATTYVKEAYDEVSGQNVNRGLVLGRVGGLTGARSRFSADRLAGASDAELQKEFSKAMSAGEYDVNTATDAEEYHIMTDHSIYIDINGMVEIPITQPR